MANQAKKTEHSGAKKGEGAYWGARFAPRRKAIAGADATTKGHARTMTPWTAFPSQPSKR